MNGYLWSWRARKEPPIGRPPRPSVNPLSSIHRRRPRSSPVINLNLSPPVVANKSIRLRGAVKYLGVVDGIAADLPDGRKTVRNFIVVILRCRMYYMVTNVKQATVLRGAFKLSEKNTIFELQLKLYNHSNPEQIFTIAYTSRVTPAPVTISYR